MKPISTDKKIGIAICFSFISYQITNLLEKKTFYDDSLYWLLFVMSAAIVIWGGYKIKLLPLELTDNISKVERRTSLSIFMSLIFIGSFFLSGNVLNLLVLSTNYALLSPEVKKEKLDIVKVYKHQLNRGRTTYTCIEFTDGHQKKSIKAPENEFERLQKCQHVGVEYKTGLCGFEVLIKVIPLPPKNLFRIKMAFFCHRKNKNQSLIYYFAIYMLYFFEIQNFFSSFKPNEKGKTLNSDNQQSFS